MRTADRTDLAPVDLNYIAFSLETWNSLDADQQLTVQRSRCSGGLRAPQATDRKQLAAIRSQGVEIYTPDLAAFREHVRAQYVDPTWPQAGLRVYLIASTR